MMAVNCRQDGQAKTAAAYKAQSLIEFTLVAMTFLMLIFGVCQFGVAFARRASIDYRVSNLEQALPEGWDGTDKVATIREAIAAESMIDADKLALANVKVNATRVNEVAEDSESEYFGGVLSTHTYVVYDISGDLSYPVGDGLAILGDATYTRHFERSFRIENREELS